MVLWGVEYRVSVSNRIVPSQLESSWLGCSLHPTPTHKMSLPRFSLPPLPPPPLPNSLFYHRKAFGFNAR
jgi:hypothetical protein